MLTFLLYTLPMILLLYKSYGIWKGTKLQTTVYELVIDVNKRRKLQVNRDPVTETEARGVLAAMLAIVALIPVVNIIVLMDSFIKD